MMRKWVKTAVPVVVASALIGCQASNTPPADPAKTADAKSEPAKSAATDKKITIRFATNYTGTSGLGGPTTKLLDKFKAENPQVDLVIETAPGFDLANKIKIDAASNNTPDVFNYWRPDPNLGMDKIIASGAIADLTELKTDPDIKDLFDEDAWKTATVDGKVRAMPMILFYNMPIVNKDIFAKCGLKLPETWDDWLAAVKVLKEKGYIPWAVSTIPAKSGTIERPLNYVLDRMLGAQRVSDLFEGLEPFNKPDVIKALDYAKELMAGYAPDDASALEDQAVFAKYVNTGKTAIIISNSGAMATVKPELLDQWVPVEFPLIPGGVETEKRMIKDLTQLYFAGAKGYADPVKKPYIVKLLKLMTGKEAGKMYYEDGGSPIPMKGVQIDTSKIPKVIVQASDIADKRPGNYWMGKKMDNAQRDKVWPLLADFWVGKYTGKQFAEKLDEAYKK
ncbi:ABC transporter substrate-binding protein [Paenibacillus thalictri]|uniref:Extracellular solute-binding protein n=1 Tax=Paenibacillus thalictri TaxID=2527873 RepID=A0A4V2J3L6_9BACL|nr:extracellular solute-binding protein [Paenibacillus thalictri]TBL73307.1 extracellular solute-binding protein [Paenibacillus thalictri]